MLLAVEAPALGGNTLTPTIPEDDTVMEKLLKVKVRPSLRLLISLDVRLQYVRSDSRLIYKVLLGGKVFVTVFSFQWVVVTNY